LHDLRDCRRFDSLAVEASGNIRVAKLVRGGISVFSPGRDLIEFHETPEVFCTNICLGGDRMQDPADIIKGGHFALLFPNP
jgi:gluconolactonase